MRIDQAILKVSSIAIKRLFHLSERKVICNREKDPNIISMAISELLLSDKPIMIARYGATELMCMVNYIGVRQGIPNLFNYLLGKELDWWWKKSSLVQIEQWSGFFPPTIPNLEQFCKIMIEDSRSVDILASWLDHEIYFKEELSNAKLIQGLFLDPFWSDTPWTSSLKGKKVLVIHPFENAIKNQYAQRENLFENKNILPEFELKTIRAVQSLGGECEFNSWFEALEYMKSAIDKTDFDICLIGCGSYGFPLAAYVKRIGKKAIHMGGSLQLLFGIKGKRWENPNYGIKELGKEGMYQDLLNNKYWIYPGKEGKPKNAEKVESACYW
jgi:hypothetical protein